MNKNNAVILLHPGWTGGKFLISCLGLSNYCGFQTVDSYSMTPQEKFNYLMKELDLVDGLWDNGVHTPGTWSDFRMGNESLLGTDNHYNIETYSDEFKKITNSKKYFFINCHSMDSFNEFLKIWNDAIIIYISNPKKFIVWRKNLDNYDKFYGEEYTDQTFGFIQNLKFNWDADWFLDENKFITEIENLYNKLNLDDFNRVLILQFYHRYIQILTKLRNVNL